MITQTEVNTAFVQVCGTGNIELAHYFLTNEHLVAAGTNADIHTCDDIAVRYACKYGRLDMLKYLLESPDLKEHGNIHAKDDYAFRWACLNNHTDIVDYLVFEKNIPKSDGIYFFLNNPHEPYEAKKLAWDAFQKQAQKPKLYIVSKTVTK